MKRLHKENVSITYNLGQRAKFTTSCPEQACLTRYSATLYSRQQSCPLLTMLTLGVTASSVTLNEMNKYQTAELWICQRLFDQLATGT